MKFLMRLAILFYVSFVMIISCLILVGCFVFLFVPNWIHLSDITNILYEAYYNEDLQRMGSLSA